MRRPTLVVLVVFAAALAAATVQADVVVAIHGHSNFSDGMKPLRETYAEMRSGGAEVAIVTDHAEVVELTALPSSFVMWELHSALAQDALKEAFVSRWKETYQGLQREGVVVIPAMEVGLIAKSPDKLTDRYCHFLFIGGSVNDDTYDRVVQWTSAYSTEAGAVECLKKLAALAQERGAVIIAAHPTNPDHLIGNDLIRLVEGAEVMNHARYNLGKDTPEMLLGGLPGVTGAPLVVAGIDWHGVVEEEGFGPAWEYIPSSHRYSVLLTDDRTPAGLQRALKGRRCYAAFGGARVTQGKDLIGGEIALDQPFEMGFEGVSGDKAWLVCRSLDGISCRGPVEVPMIGNRLSGRLDQLLGLYAGGMSQGGWLVIAAPTGTPRIITSGIKVLPASNEGNPAFTFYDEPQGQEAPGTASPEQVVGQVQPVTVGTGITLEDVLRLTPEAYDEVVEGLRREGLLPGTGGQVPQSPLLPRGTVPQGKLAESGEDFGNWPMEFTGDYPAMFKPPCNQGKYRLFVDPAAQKGLLLIQFNDWNRRIQIDLPGAFGDQGQPVYLSWKVEFTPPERMTGYWTVRAVEESVERVELSHLHASGQDPKSYNISLTLVCTSPWGHTSTFGMGGKRVR